MQLSKDNIQTFFFFFVAEQLTSAAEMEVVVFYINSLIFIWLPCRNNHCPLN